MCPISNRIVVASRTMRTQQARRLQVLDVAFDSITTIIQTHTHTTQPGALLGAAAAVRVGQRARVESERAFTPGTRMGSGMGSR